MNQGSPRRLRLAVCALVVAPNMVVSIPPAAAAPLSSRSFQTPSGNIVCLLQSDNVLRCDIGSGLNPEPKRDCDLDWVGILLSRSSRATPNCAGDSIGGGDPPVLEYGKRWERRNRYCISRRTGLHCFNASGYHFMLSRDQWRRWYTP